MATLIEIIACVGIYLASGFIPSKDQAYVQRVNAFFIKLATPLSEAEKPKVDYNFMRIMNRLYAVALLITGLLFAAMSIPSIYETSGQFAMSAAIVCLILAIFLWGRNSMAKKNEPIWANTQEVDP